MPALEIPEEVIDKVVAALNQGIGLAMRFEPSMVAEMSTVASELDDAINDAQATEP